MHVRVPRAAPRLPRRRGRGRRPIGQALVEFALVLPVLLVTLLLAVDAGRLYFGWVALQNMSRIGANFAADNPDAWPASNPTTQQLQLQQEYSQEIHNDATTVDCVLPSPLPTPAFPDPSPNTYSLGSRAVVSLTCNFSLVTPVLGSILGNPVHLGASTVYPIRAGAISVVPVPTATPIPTAAPTATPQPTSTPAMCTVPTYLNVVQANKAQGLWNSAGFTKTNLIITVQGGSGGQTYTIETESSAGITGDYDGQTEPCATFQLTVGPAQ